ncbi:MULTISPECIES: sensor histidine kinase [unclassified Nocardiopsis]|uniref:sensor histidine kinase n=1 Tax=Nocardiopsis TaxID=2013 RepID=UPI00387B4D77
MGLNRIVEVLGGPLGERILWGGAGVVLALAVVADLLTVRSGLAADTWPGPPHGPWDWLPATSGAVAGGLVLLALRPRAGAAATGWAALAVPLVVAAASLALWPQPKGMFGYPIAVSEAFALLLALAVTALRCDARWIGAVSAAAFLAAASDRLREGSGDSLTSALLLVAVGLAPGLYLRWRRYQREYHVERARTQERLAVARDLHDVVAHEVTGIVVQAQALRRIADTRPEAAVRALPEIEAAGARALEAMRSLVSRLREPDEAPPVPDAAQGLARLAGTVGGLEVEVRVDGSLTGLAPEVGTALVRIAEEAVTNARRHARGASLVSVEVEAGTGDGVRMAVRDNGRGSGGGGGFGLVGMAERARLLGGGLTAGPGGGGWEVHVHLPERPCG